MQGKNKSREESTPLLKPGEMMEKNEYMRNRAEYERSWLYKMRHRTRVIMHPLLLCAITLKNIFSGFKTITLPGSKVPQTDRPIIFCITHIGKHDIEVCSQILKKHYYLLSGDFENLHGTSDGMFIELNGIIYLNKYDKEDKTKSKETSVTILKKGGNIMWFPEGIWNLSPNQPVLPLPFGIIEVALKANAAIIPVAIEQYGKEFYINIGSIFDVAQYVHQYTDELALKMVAIADLRDVMATLKWQIWEYIQPCRRAELPRDYFDLFVNDRLKEWHGFTYEDVRAREFHFKNITEPKEAFAHLQSIEPNMANAFLFNKRLIG